MNQQVVDLLRDLGVQLGTTAENLWRVIVAAQRIEGIFDLAAGIFVVIAILIASRVIWKTDWEGESKFIVIVSANVFWVLAFALLHSALIAIYAPEYSALKFILRRLSGR